MKRIIKYTVPAGRDGVLLRDILRRELSISATLLRRMKREQDSILKNGHPAYVTAEVSAGDELTLTIEEESVNTRVVPREGALDIVFENEDLLVINKPADLTVHPTSGHYDDSLANILVGMMGENFIFRPVSRLDRGTSGLMAVAKNSYSHTFLASQNLEREYLAVCEGVPGKPCGTIDAPIGRVDGSVLLREVRLDGKAARTHFEVLRVAGGRALVKLKLDTGRTHQIRVHMKSIGCPLVGDFLYGEEIAGMNRFALHSAYLGCNLPFSNERLELNSPLPHELEELLG
ncbi:MAG: RluA family pseudouridine synthase [Clostridia bacterium]|nr:RluA family pseudouridine synthase [Clostridia bacterium]